MAIDITLTSITAEPIVRMVFKQISIKIEQMCIDNPKHFKCKFAQESDKLPTQLEKVVEDLNNRPLGVKKWRFKNRMIYAVINGGVFVHSLAESVGITLDDVQKRYNKYAHYLDFLADKQNDNDFKHYILTQARISYQSEQNKIAPYNEKSFLRQLVDPAPPKLCTRGDLNRVNKERTEITQKIERLNFSRENGEIDVVEFLPKKRELVIEKNFLGSAVMVKLRRLDAINKDTNTKKNFNFMSLVSNDLLLQDKSIFQLQINTLTSAKFAIEEYCRWFNTINKVAINQASKMRTDERNNRLYKEKYADKIQAKQDLNKEEQKIVFSLSVQGKSLRDISNETGLSYYKVRTIVSKIKALIENQ